MDFSSEELEGLRDQLTNWSGTIRTELERCCRLRGVPEALRNQEEVLKAWSELSKEEQSADPFAGCLPLGLQKRKRLLKEMKRDEKS